MQSDIAALVLVLFLGIVVARVLVMSTAGISAMQIGKTHRSDFLIPPFVLIYFYVVFARAFGWPTFASQAFFESAAVSWVGVLLCMAGLITLVISLVSFGRSFRVGIDNVHPDKLVTTGIFAVSRNPIYVGFWIILIGQFLIFPNWLLLLYIALASWLFHRQVLREESFLSQHYGREYDEYCSRVRRYI